MKPFVLKFALACGFAAGTVGLPLVAADDPKPGEKKKTDKAKSAETKPADAKPADWSNYVKHGDPVAGEVMKADADGIMLRLSGVGLKTNAYGGLSRRPALKELHEDFELKYADGGQARWKKLPPKVGADGKKATYTDKELAELKKPQGFPGYAAERTDVKQGHLVEVHLVRPKTVPASKATNDDLLVKYLTITGEKEIPSKPDRKEPPAAKKKDK